MDARGSKFDYRAGQIGHSVVKSSPPLRRFFEVVLPRHDAAEMGLLVVTRLDVILQVLSNEDLILIVLILKLRSWQNFED